MMKQKLLDIVVLTWIKPGRIIQSLKKAKFCPVFLIDEKCKMTKDFKGDQLVVY